jgi:hypothetical protein
MEHRLNMETFRVFALAVFLLHAVFANLAHAQGRFSFSADGAEVTDSQTGLVWRRCSEGQTWNNGACVGDANTLTLQESYALAKTQSGWRVPNAKELSSLVDRSRFNPAIDPIAFPQTQSAFYWTSTPYLKEPVPPVHMAVLFSFGHLSVGAATGNYMTGASYLRLVR